MKFRIVWAPVGYVISETYEVNCMSAGGADQDERGNEEFERLSRTNGSGCTLRGPGLLGKCIENAKSVGAKGGTRNPTGRTPQDPESKRSLSGEVK